MEHAADNSAALMATKIPPCGPGPTDPHTDPHSAPQTDPPANPPTVPVFRLSPPPPRAIGVYRVLRKKKKRTNQVHTPPPHITEGGGSAHFHQRSRGHSKGLCGGHSWGLSRGHPMRAALRPVRPFAHAGPTTYNQRYAGYSYAQHAKRAKGHNHTILPFRPSCPPFWPFWPLLH